MSRFPDLSHVGRPAPGLGTPVNPMVERASTLLFDRAEDLYRTDVRGYGRHGNAVQDALEDAIRLIEGGEHVSLAPSGLAACTLAILSFARAGSHVLVTDSAYGPTRAFCQTLLPRYGVDVEFYDPRIGAEIGALLRDNTSLVWLESPGSLTFEVQDIPAIVAAADGVPTAIDNTWSGGLTLKPLEMGVTASVQAATKYWSGHSDVLLGSVTCRDKSAGHRVAQTRKLLGHSVSPDDAYLVLRGIRTLASRFEQAETSAQTLAETLAAHPKVAQVLHPALPTHPDHALWRAQFSGGGCLFGFTLADAAADDAVALVNALESFGIGYSYGGYESLAIHCDPQLRRDHPVALEGPLIRLACGTEPTDTLKSDVIQALAAIR